MDEFKTIKATKITMQTLVGSSGPYPRNFGNCFSVAGEDGQHYKIVNFKVENLEELGRRGINLPVEIHVIEGSVAIIHDARIPDDWYDKRFCEVCCPEHLLPLPQKLIHAREVLQGVRVIGDKWIQVSPGKKPIL